MALNATQASVRIMSVLQEELRVQYSEGNPYGGKIPPERVQHRVGSAVALDGFSTEYGQECEGLVWATVLRQFRTDPFPQEIYEARSCGAPRALLVQLGVARCSSTMTDDGSAPDPAVVQDEAVRGLDDVGRMDRAVCRAAARLLDQDAILAWAPDAIEPVGPDGGVITFVTQVAFLLP